jgi:hypothetical protein
MGLETLGETHGLPVKKNALDKVRKPLVGFSALVDLWRAEGIHEMAAEREQEMKSVHFFLNSLDLSSDKNQ